MTTAIKDTLTINNETIHLGCETHLNITEGQDYITLERKDQSNTYQYDELAISINKSTGYKKITYNGPKGLTLHLKAELIESPDGSYEEGYITITGRNNTRYCITIANQKITLSYFDKNNEEQIDCNYDTDKLTLDCLNQALNRIVNIILTLNLKHDRIPFFINKSPLEEILTSVYELYQSLEYFQNNCSPKIAEYLKNIYLSIPKNLTRILEKEQN